MTVKSNLNQEGIGTCSTARAWHFWLPAFGEGMTIGGKWWYCWVGWWYASISCQYKPPSYLHPMQVLSGGC